MEQTRVSKRFFILAALSLAILIAVTRGISLTHNMYGHPDEHVFYTSSELLMLDLLGEDTYEPVKAYPEGTYVFRLPFQLAARAVQLGANYDVSVAIWGRIASVFYYTLGALLGLWLVCDPLKGGRAGALIYVLTVGFGLFQIEQSRYGTFDPLSFFVLALVIVLCTLALRREKRGFLLGASFAVGVAAAGKYPLFYFVLLPLSVLLLQKARGRGLRRTLALMAGCALIGFLLFSPSVVRSPRFFYRTILGGLRGYVTTGNPEGYSTVLETAFSNVVYHGLYSELPLAGIFALLCVRHLSREGADTEERRFFTAALPAVTLVFLGYNLLMKAFFMRTVYPYYCISMLYAAAGLGQLCRKRAWRWAALALCLLMVIRASVLIALLGDHDREEQAVEELLQLAESSGEGELLVLGNNAFDGELCLRMPESAQIIYNVTLYEGDFPTLLPGMRILTASMEHGIAKTCLFPPNKEWIINIDAGWERFREENAPWLVAKLYPDWIYTLFGFWVHGSTATTYEFPTNWLYIRPAE